MNQIFQWKSKIFIVGYFLKCFFLRAIYYLITVHPRRPQKAKFRSLQWNPGIEIWTHIWKHSESKFLMNKPKLIKIAFFLECAICYFITNTSEETTGSNILRLLTKNREFKFECTAENRKQWIGISRKQAKIKISF